MPARTFRTEKQLNKIPPPPKPSDGQKAKALFVMHQKEPGLGVWIMPPTARGRVRRVWFVRVGMAREKIGTYPEMSLEEAKLHAITLRQEAADARSRGITGENTVGQIVESFRSLKSPTWSAATKENFEKRIEYIKPRIASDKNSAHTEHGIWNVKLRKLRTVQLQKMFDEITAKAAKTNQERKIEGDGRPQAAAIGRLVYAVLNHACELNMLAWNPMRPIKKALFNVTHRRSRHLKVSDIPKFFHWLETHAHPAGRDFILITLFMCLRKGIAGQLRWDQLDSRRWTLTVPKDTRGNKARQMFVHPIPDYLIEVVFKPRLADRNRHPEWIIPSVSRNPKIRGTQPLKDVRSLLEDSLLKRTGIKISPHDWRRSFATWMHQATGGDDLLTRRALTHNLQSSGETDATSAGYIIKSTEQLRVAMNQMTEFVFAIANNPRKIDEDAYEASAARVAEMIKRDKRSAESKDSGEGDER